MRSLRPALVPRPQRRDDATPVPVSAVTDAIYYAIDKVIGRWNGENGFLALADDHGRYSACTAYGNGHAGSA